MTPEQFESAKKYLLENGDILHDLSMPLMNARRPYDAMVLGSRWMRIHMEDFINSLEMAKKRIEETLEELQS